MRKVLFGLAMLAASIGLGSSPAGAINSASAVRCVYAANHSSELPHGDWDVLYAEPYAMSVGRVTDACWLQWVGPGNQTSCAFYATTTNGGSSEVGQVDCN